MFPHWRTSAANSVQEVFLTLELQGLTTKLQEIWDPISGNLRFGCEITAQVSSIKPWSSFMINHTTSDSPSLLVNITWWSKIGNALLENQKCSLKIGNALLQIEKPKPLFLFLNETRWTVCQVFFVDLIKETVNTVFFTGIRKMASEVMTVCL